MNNRVHMKNFTLFICFFILCAFSTFSAEIAKPKEGEGIYQFLRNNGRNPVDYYDSFVELNKNKLGKNQLLMMGVSYTLPPLATGKLSSTSSDSKSTEVKSGAKNTFVEPLFGKKYSEYTIQSKKLAGATFYLVSGHGGPDPGTIGYVNGTAIHEVEYAYDVMLRLARSLMMEGATVHVIIQDKQNGIRDDALLKLNKNKTCMGKVIPRSQVARLQQRCDEINVLSSKSKNAYQRAVFIHLDSRSVQQKVDVFFYYNEKSAPGKRLANTMRTTFKNQYQKHQPNRGFEGTVSSRSLHVLNNTNTVSLFAELGNIQNSFDQKRFIDSGQRQALAKWMCLGLIADYENSKK